MFMEEKRLTQWGQLRCMKTKVLMFPALLPKICVPKMYLWENVCGVCMCVANRVGCKYVGEVGAIMERGS